MWKRGHRFEGTGFYDQNGVRNEDVDSAPPEDSTIALRRSRFQSITIGNMMFIGHEHVQRKEALCAELIERTLFNYCTVPRVDESLTSLVCTWILYLIHFYEVSSIEREINLKSI